MSRLPTPATIEAAPAASRPFLEGVKKQLGTVPNMFRLISNSPAALEGYVGLSAALNKGARPAQTRERIALAVAEINGCAYCLSAHTYLGKNLAKLDDAEIAANRNGASNDFKQATEIARLMVTEYGMSEALGPISYSDRGRSPFLRGAEGMAGLTDKAYSERTQRRIDEEVSRLVEEAMQRAREARWKWRLERLLSG